MSELLKPVFAALETNEQNSDGVAVTLYFTEDPSPEEIRAACRATTLPLRVNPNDEFFEFDFCPNVLSGYAGLCRVQCHPTC